MPDLDPVSVLQDLPDVDNVREVSLKTLHSRQREIAKYYDRFFRFTLTINDASSTLQAHDLIMGLQALPLRYVPKVWFTDPTRVSTQPHVDFHGAICYVEDELGVLLDIRNPEAVISHAIDRVVVLLTRNMMGEMDELFDEYEAFWLSLPESLEVDSYLERYDRVDVIDCSYVHVRNKGKFQNTPILLGAVPDACVRQDLPKRNIKKKGCVIIPLPDTPVPPSMADGLTINYLRNLIASVPQEIGEEFRKRIEHKYQRKKGGDFCLIFSFPGKESRTTLLGVHLEGQSPVPFFTPHDTERWSLRPFCVKRHTRSHLLARGGAMPDLDALTVAVVGCGSVGSQVVELLARAGVGHLVLVDHDHFSANNLFRHTLGTESIGRFKVVQLANHLRISLPGIDVTPVTKLREYWLKENPLDAIDLIIDATADQTGGLIFSEMVKVQRIPTVFCWLEPLGLGGHAVLVAPDITGCLECYFDRAESGPYFRKQFLRPGERVIKDLTGCGGIFTPFSTLDATRTATLAVDMLLGYHLRGERVPYRFWKGSPDQALAEGKRLSDWYEEADSSQPFDHERAKFYLSCQACRERHGRS